MLCNPSIAIGTFDLLSTYLATCKEACDIIQFVYQFPTDSVMKQLSSVLFSEK